MKDTGIIIQARIGSTRLPAKILMEINGVKNIHRVIERCRASKYGENTILAIPDNDTFSYESNCPVFGGSELDVLKRYYDCATHYSFKTIIRITADCPLVPPFEINRVADYFHESGSDYVTNRPEVPDGWDVEIFTYESLKHAHEYATKPFDREHVTPYIKRLENIKKITLEAPKLSVDTEDDLERIREFYELERKVNSHHRRDGIICDEFHPFFT